MKRPLPLANPHMTEEGYELEYVHDAFNKNWIAPLGENVTQLEIALAEYLNQGPTIALAAGTAALHLSLILSGVKAGDLVFCQDLTFCASANPITYLGAEPVFIDSERDTWNMDPGALERAFALYGKPKAVVVVHLYGNPAKMDEICAICDREGVILIEDAAEALGSEYKGRKCGTFGRFGVLSFNGNKIITTSGGGMLVCQNQEDGAHALKLATQAREPFPWYQHEEIGFNYRLSNICAGIGRGQVKVLPLRVEKKREIYQGYADGLAGLPLRLQPMTDGNHSNCWLSSILLDEDCPVTPMQVLSALKADSIDGRPLWKPMHSQPVYANAKYVTAGGDSVSEDLFNRGICLPSDTRMTGEDIDRVCGVIRSLF